MKVCSYVKSNDGCTYHRVLVPNNHIAGTRVVNELSDEVLEWCDILHYSRHSLMSPEFLDKKRKQFGFKIVVDTDDDWEVPKSHPKYESWSRGNIALQIRLHLMNADAVTCTHERLARKVSALNKNVYVIPSFIEGQKPSAVRSYKVLYASSGVNYHNLSVLGNTFKRVNADIVVAGYSKDDVMYDRMSGYFYDNKVTKIPWMPVEKYMESYKGSVLIVPSKDIEFNSMKSNIKLLEAGALKIPAIVSDADPYKGFPVRYASGETEWVGHLEELRSPELRKKEGKMLHDFCMDVYNPKDITHIRESIYDEIIQRHTNNNK